MSTSKEKASIAIYGAGAIGGHLGAMLSKAGFEVSLIARGDHLKAIEQNGLRLIAKDQDFITRPRVTSNPSELGPQDYVIMSLKSYQAPDVVEQMQPLLGENTTVATAMNGIPWWYFYGLPGQWENHKIKSVDPEGKQWDGIRPERAIGCITYVASEVVEPGIVKTISPSYQYQIGEPDGSVSPRCKLLQRMVVAAGINCDIKPNIRRDIWIKVMGNVAYNPTSALTMAHTGAKQVLIVGGVGCNVRLQEMMDDMVRARGSSLCAMDHRYCIDNGAMIAQAGIFAYQMNQITPMREATCTQRFRTDQVDVVWRPKN